MPSQLLSVLVELFLSTFDWHWHYAQVSSVNFYFFNRNVRNTTFLKIKCVLVCCRDLCGILGPSNSIACWGGILQRGDWSQLQTHTWFRSGDMECHTNKNSPLTQQCVLQAFYYCNINFHLCFWIAIFFNHSNDRRSDMYGQHMARITLLIYLLYCV